MNGSWANNIAFKILLLLVSVSSFLVAILISNRTGIRFLLIKNFLVSISFLSLTIIFVISRKFQDIMNIRPNRKVMSIFFSMGFILFLTVSFLLNGADTDYVVSEALDAIAYFIQAKIFSTGQISVPSHELREFFSTRFFINDGKFYSKYFPGWPLVLSLGIVLRIPWGINPIIGFLTLFVVYLIGKEIYDKRTGLFAVLLLASTFSFYWFTSTYMSEPSALFFSSLFFYFVIKAIKGHKNLDLLLAGLSLGMTFLIRPYSALTISLPTMTYFYFSSISKKRKSLIPFAIIILAFLPWFLMGLAYNYCQTGSILVTPHQYYNPFDTIGFGLRSTDVSNKPHLYTLFDGLKNLSINLLNLNLETGLFLFLPFLFMNIKNKWDVLLISFIVTVIVSYILYFHRALRYYYPVWFAVVLLVARGMHLSEITFSKLFPNISIKYLKYYFLVFMICSNICISISRDGILNRYERYKQFRDPFNVVKTNNLNNAIIFPRTVPGMYQDIGRYIQNSLDFSGDVLFARDLKEKNIKLMEYYPEKEFYYYDYDIKSKSGKLTKVNRN